MYVDPFVIRSLNRSELRKRILFYLDSIYPSPAYLSEIARAIGSDPANVKGALVGLGNRYSEDSSLVNLGLVEVIEKDGFKHYALTNYGRNVVKLLKSYHPYYSLFRPEG
ncbi:MAG: transcriptional regulator [Thermococci archaeon]|nr:transcriptional regulator [Thermococci archaeon]